MQCVNWGPDSPWFDNPTPSRSARAAAAPGPTSSPAFICRTSPVLTAAASPSPPARLKSLNIGEGVSASSYEFDEYNISLFWQPQRQRSLRERLPRPAIRAAYDLRVSIPCRAATAATGRTSIPTRTATTPGCARKLTFLGGGYLDDPIAPPAARPPLLPAASPCIAWHTYYTARNAEPGSGFYKYQLMSGLGIAAAEEMGGHHHPPAARGLGTPESEGSTSLRQRLAPPARRTRPTACPARPAPPNSDGVLFKRASPP